VAELKAFHQAAEDATLDPGRLTYADKIHERVRGDPKLAESSESARSERSADGTFFARPEGIAEKVEGPGTIDRAQPWPHCCLLSGPIPLPCALTLHP